MPLKVVGDYKALLEVWVQVIFKHLCLPVLVPPWLFGITLMQNEAYGVGVSLAEPVHILELSALNEELDLVPDRVLETVLLSESRVIVHLYKNLIYIINSLKS